MMLMGILTWKVGGILLVSEFEKSAHDALQFEIVTIYGKLIFLAKYSCLFSLGILSSHNLQRDVEVSK